MNQAKILQMDANVRIVSQEIALNVPRLKDVIKVDREEGGGL